ncbi:MAG: F0F1 ATP synthase subunit B [bacterium]
MIASAASHSSSAFTNPGLVVFTWITFILLLGLMYRFGWDPIMDALTSREEKIQDDLTTAEEEREKAEQLRKEREEELNEAHSEAREIVENSREKGEKERERIIEEAREDADSMVEEAEDEIERQRQQAFDEVEGEVGEMALNLAEKLLKREIDEEEHGRLVDEFLDQVDNEEPSTVG